MTQLLPEKCFISHSYKDAQIRDELIASLPDYVEPYVFPPITVKPHQLVSNVLIEAILGCPGLIYLNGGASAQSFWVAFERDYALRSGKAVYAADSSTLSISPHEGAPLDLPAFPSYHRQDYPRIKEIFTFLRQKRFFDLWVDTEEILPGTVWQDEISEALTERLGRGGYAVVFWSQAAASSKWVELEIAEAARGIADFNDRVLFVLLDNTPVPNFWLNFNEPCVQLYGDTERSTYHRMDDLVVRLYWLIYRNTQYRHLE
ncbi:MAG: toll/interleukin-1 receptor domain-containing protein [Acidobacteriota bacterium]